MNYLNGRAEGSNLLRDWVRREGRSRKSGCPDEIHVFGKPILRLWDCRGNEGICGRRSWPKLGELMMGAGEMTQQIRVLGTKLDDQGSIPGTHMVDLENHL